LPLLTFFSTLTRLVTKITLLAPPTALSGAQQTAIPYFQPYARDGRTILVFVIPGDYELGVHGSKRLKYGHGKPQGKEVKNG
jgi:hypothetical protein